MGLGRHGNHARERTLLTPRRELALAELSSGESASRPRRPALSATPLFSSRGIVGATSSPNPPCVAVALLAIPPLACRRPRTHTHEHPRHLTRHSVVLTEATLHGVSRRREIIPALELLHDVRRIGIYIRLVPEMAADSVDAGAVRVTALSPARRAVPDRCGGGGVIAGVLFFAAVVHLGGTCRWAEGSGKEAPNIKL